MKLRKIITGILIMSLIYTNTAVYAAEYADVPAGHWAKEVIGEAAETGIMQGIGNGIFGIGNTIKRSEFAAMLTRLMRWNKSTAESSYFSDVQNGAWYFADVNTLAEHEIENESEFRPEDSITRREMAVMLVKALGYSELAKTEKNDVFADVSEDEGYISVAHTLGIINGKAEGMFDPEGLALREEGAAMMMRMYSKYNAQLEEIHGFYALSSWGQRDIAAQMDAVSFGWSRLQYTDEGKVFLNTTAEDGNDWNFPEGYQEALDYMKSNSVSVNLAVTMTDMEDCGNILLNEQNRSEAITQIIASAKEFNGVTIDFEGMKGETLKNGFNEFIIELKENLGKRPLYVAVHPVLKHSSEYFDAYDYKTLGRYADRVILMAHDYAANTLPDNLINTDFTATPVTPFDEVYTALKAITDSQTGVEDLAKIQLGISTASTAAWYTKDRKIINAQAVHPSVDTVQKRLAQQSTEITYSEIYKNPYAWYTTEKSGEILLWYEDSRSVEDKIKLAGMFGINSVSLWRIGAVANGNAEQYMDIWNTVISKQKKQPTG